VFVDEALLSTTGLSEGCSFSAIVSHLVKGETCTGAGLVRVELNDASSRLNSHRWYLYEIVMPREVCMQNEFFNFVIFCIKQDVHPHCEVVIEVVGLQRGGFPVCIWRMNFHFVFRFVKYSTRGPDCRHDILNGIAEPDGPLYVVLVRISNRVAATSHFPHVWF